MTFVCTSYIFVLFLHLVSILNNKIKNNICSLLVMLLSTYSCSLQTIIAVFLYLEREKMAILGSNCYWKNSFEKQLCYLNTVLKKKYGHHVFMLLFFIFYDVHTF
jgi:hypothetical protein